MTSDIFTHTERMSVVILEDLLELATWGKEVESLPEYKTLTEKYSRDVRIIGSYVDKKTPTVGEDLTQISNPMRVFDFIVRPSDEPGLFLVGYSPKGLKMCVKSIPGSVIHTEKHRVLGVKYFLGGVLLVTNRTPESQGTGLSNPVLAKVFSFLNPVDRANLSVTVKQARKINKGISKPEPVVLTDAKQLGGVPWDTTHLTIKDDKFTGGHVVYPGNLLSLTIKGKKYMGKGSIYPVCLQTLNVTGKSSPEMETLPGGLKDLVINDSTGMYTGNFNTLPTHLHSFGVVSKSFTGEGMVWSPKIKTIFINADHFDCDEKFPNTVKELYIMSNKYGKKGHVNIPPELEKLQVTTTYTPQLHFPDTLNYLDARSLFLNDSGIPPEITHLSIRNGGGYKYDLADTKITHLDLSDASIHTCVSVKIPRYLEHLTVHMYNNKFLSSKWKEFLNATSVKIVGFQNNIPLGPRVRKICIVDNIFTGKGLGLAKGVETLIIESKTFTGDDAHNLLRYLKNITITSPVISDTFVGKLLDVGLESIIVNGVKFR